MDNVAHASALDRGALFRQAEAAVARRLPAAIVEKDFWVCWSLR